ncbi:MAG: DUF86 domain-containing protein [Phycisphaerales bacterium]|nr:DUF86 domain-containing protein [Phycisphaerales bacterium]
MSPRDWPQRVRDMLEAIAEIESFVAGMDEAAFAADLKTQRAVTATLTIIGEAARHIPDELERSSPHLPWKDMRSTRNFIVHIYHEIEPAILWQTIRDDLPPLVAPLRGLLQMETRE